MRTLPHLTYLQAFEASARHLSFSKAAEELNCTQSAISQRVRALEQYLARPLFHRRRNGLELSEVGQAYQPGVAEALDVLEAATQGLTGSRVRRAVTVSAPISFVSTWFSQNLCRFHALHPDIEVRLNSTIWTDPNVDLADLSIVVVDNAQLKPEMTSLGCDRMVLVARPDEEPAGRDMSAWVNARRQVYVQGKHQLWDRWAKAGNVRLAPALPTVKVDNSVTALELISRSGGLTVVFSTYAEPYLTAGRLITPAGSDTPTTLGHTVAFNPARAPHASSRKFHEWLLSEFSGQPR